MRVRTATLHRPLTNIEAASPHEVPIAYLLGTTRNKVERCAPATVYQTRRRLRLARQQRKVVRPHAVAAKAAMVSADSCAEIFRSWIVAPPNAVDAGLDGCNRSEALLLHQRRTARRSSV
jgi:hypothetical protein